LALDAPLAVPLGSATKKISACLPEQTAAIQDSYRRVVSRGCSCNSARAFFTSRQRERDKALKL
jgi:hypothetical protein